MTSTTSITGMMKIFKQNLLVNQQITLTASTGDASADNVKDFDKSTKWSSVGTDDTTVETFDVIFTSYQVINRILLILMNFKVFTIKWWDGAAYQDFSNVFSKIDDSVGSSISESDNSDTDRYYEFDTVVTKQIRISITSTFVPDVGVYGTDDYGGGSDYGAIDQEKTLAELYVGKEIGTFVEDLTSSPNSFEPIFSDTNSVYIKKSNGGFIKYEKSDKWMADVSLSEILETNDQAIINTMYDDGQFAILPCGAVPYTQRGWRLQDFYNVTIRGDLESEFAIGRVASVGLNYDFDLLEQ